MENIKNAISKYRNYSILDVGTGKGMFLSKMLPLFTNFKQIIGVDPDLPSIEIAKKSFTDEKIQFEHLTSSQLPFKDNSFDIILMSNALHHLEDISSSFKEINRVRKKDGMVLLFEMSRDLQNPAQNTFIMYHDMRSETDRLRGNFHADIFTKKEITNIIESNNLKIIENSLFTPGNNPFPSDEDLEKHLEDLLVKLSDENKEIYKNRITEFKQKKANTGLEMPNMQVFIGK